MKTTNSKFVLVSAHEKDLDVQFFNTSEEAYKQMEDELKEAVDSEGEAYISNEDNETEDNDYGLDRNSAWSNVGDENYDWLIREVQ